jgi:hypothetical protein
MWKNKIIVLLFIIAQAFNKTGQIMNEKKQHVYACKKECVEMDRLLQRA